MDQEEVDLGFRGEAREGLENEISMGGGRLSSVAPSMSSVMIYIDSASASIQVHEILADF